MNQIKIFEKYSDEKLSDDLKRILLSNFYDLSETEKNKYLDSKLKFYEWDLINEKDACELFDQLDSMERYSDILLLLIAHPVLISGYFEEKSSSHKYNMEHKWDWDLSKLTYVPINSWIYDLSMTSKLINEKLRTLMRINIMKRYNIDITEEAK